MELESLSPYNQNRNEAIKEEFLITRFTTCNAPIQELLLLSAWEVTDVETGKIRNFTSTYKDPIQEISVTEIPTDNKKR